MEPTPTTSALARSLSAVPVALVEAEVLGDAAATKAQLGALLARAATLGGSSATFYRAGSGGSTLYFSFDIDGWLARVKLADLTAGQLGVLRGHADDLPVNLRKLLPAVTLERSTEVALERSTEVALERSTEVAPALVMQLGYLDGKLYAAARAGGMEPTFHEAATAIPVPEGSVPTWIEVPFVELPRPIAELAHRAGFLREEEPIETAARMGAEVVAEEAHGELEEEPSDAGSSDTLTSSDLNPAS